MAPRATPITKNLMSKPSPQSASRKPSPILLTQTHPQNRSEKGLVARRTHRDPMPFALPYAAQIADPTRVGTGVLLTRTSANRIVFAGSNRTGPGHAMCVFSRFSANFRLHSAVARIRISTGDLHETRLDTRPSTRQFSAILRRNLQGPGYGVLSC